MIWLIPQKMKILISYHKKISLMNSMQKTYPRKLKQHSNIKKRLVYTKKQLPPFLDISIIPQKEEEKLTLRQPQQ